MVTAMPFRFAGIDQDEVGIAFQYPSRKAQLIGDHQDLVVSRLAQAVDELCARSRSFSTTMMDSRRVISIHDHRRPGQATTWPEQS